MYYYNYGFVKAEENKRNPNIIDIYYGYKDMPHHIHKDRAFDFIFATLPCLREFGDSTINSFKSHAQRDPVEMLNQYMTGMPIIFATKLGSYDEYLNGCQNAVVGVTSMDINGKMNEIMIDNVTFEELYPKNDDKKSTDKNNNSNDSYLNLE